MYAVRFFLAGTVAVVDAAFARAALDVALVLRVGDAGCVFPAGVVEVFERATGLRKVLGMMGGGGGASWMVM